MCKDRYPIPFLADFWTYLVKQEFIQKLICTVFTILFASLKAMNKKPPSELSMAHLNEELCYLDYQTHTLPSSTL